MKTRFMVAASVAILCSSWPLAAQKATSAIPVFVTSAGAAAGFTDPNKDNQDTMKDLRNSLKGRKGLVVVGRQEDAAIVLTVLGRERAKVTSSFFGPGRDVDLKVKFQYREIETEMSASALGGLATTGGAWKKAAGKIADQVEDWVKANRAKLEAK